MVLRTIGNKFVLLLFSLLTLSACAFKISSIDADVTLCCADENYKTYTVSSKNIPDFLESTILGNFNMAMGEKGYQIRSENADLQIELRFEQDNLSELRKSDDFEERLGSGESLRFIARVVVDIRSYKTDRVIWSGYAQRIHSVDPGEYMHTGTASIALLDAFSEILESFPKTLK